MGKVESNESKEQEIVVNVKVEDVYDEFQIGGNADFKIGQKYPTPAPANGDRVFYESLLIQTPKSEMAQEWCVAYGVLSSEEAAKVDKIICARKGIKPSQDPKKNTPSKGKKETVIVKKGTSSDSSSSSTIIAASVTVKGKSGKRKEPSEDSVMVDLDMGGSSMWEGQGTTGF